MAPVTGFAMKERYEYLSGFGPYPHLLYCSRVKNLQTWMYKARPSLSHSEFNPYEAAAPLLSHMSPKGYMWPRFPVKDGEDRTKQKPLARNGDAANNHEVEIWISAVTVVMKPQTMVSSLDGDCLLIARSGALDIQTELGKLLVRQNGVAMIPRGMRYRVTLAGELLMATSVSCIKKTGTYLSLVLWGPPASPMSETFRSRWLTLMDSLQEMALRLTMPNGRSYLGSTALFGPTPKTIYR